MATAAPDTRRIGGSFKRRVLALVALAVALPAAATCIVLGMQLNGQTRTLFANQLKANLETFVLLLKDLDANIADGVRRTAADNTVQVTLELGIKAQLADYLEAQRRLMGADFLAAFDRNGALSAATTADAAESRRWKLAPLGAEAAECTASEALERQVVPCGKQLYLVSVAPIIRDRESIGDAATLGTSRLGTLAGGASVAAPSLMAAVEEKQLGLPLIFTADTLFHSGLEEGVAPQLPPDGTVRQYEVGDTAYLGAATPVAVGEGELRLALLSPLAPLMDLLFASLAMVAGIGVVAVLVTILLISLLVNRLLRPIGELRDGAKRIGEGDLHHRIVVQSGDELEALAGQFNDMTAKLHNSYATLEAKVEERTCENVRLIEEVQARTRELAEARLRRFLAPQVAELLLAPGEQEIALESRRCEVTVVFCDMRGFTAFAESTEPEEVMAVLREYHAALGELIFRFEGTLERFVGDGLLVVFNDPIPWPDHPQRAVNMAVVMRDRMRDLTESWRRYGHELGFGIGIAQGYATVGTIGFDRRLDYAVIGSIPNLASRLCDAAKSGQILVSQRVFVSVEKDVEATRAGDLTLKGFHKAVGTYEIIRWREPAGVPELPIEL